MGSDRAQGVEGAAGAVDKRRERAFGLLQQMLAPGDGPTGAAKWVMPTLDAGTQGRRALRLAAELQDPRALPLLVPHLQDGPVAAEARQVFDGLLPYADAGTLATVRDALSADDPARQAVEHAMAQRRSGVAAKRPERSGLQVHLSEAAHGLVDMGYDMTVGTAKQIVKDPLRFPTQMVAGMAVSLHNALRHTGGAAVGLVTGGRFGSFGAQMTAELANTAMWSSGFATPRAKGMHPEFAEVQAGAKEGFYRDLSSHGQFIPTREAMTDAIQAKTHVSRAAAEKLGNVSHAGAKKAMAFVYGTDVILPGETVQVKGTIWRRSGDEASTATHIIGTENKALNDLFANKWQEYQILNGAVKGSMPETHLGVSMLKDLGLEVPKTPAERPAFVKALQTKLNERFPQGYFLKGVRDYNTGGNLPTNKADFAAIYQGFLNEYKPLYEKLRAENPEHDLQPQLSSHPFQSGRTLEALMDNPESVIIQEKLPLKKFTEKKLPLNEQPFQEFRVHTLKGKVIPGGSSHRWSDLHNITDRKTMAQAEAFVQKVFDQLPDEIKKGTALSPDVVQLQDGSFRIIEMNAGGDSGFLHPISTGMPVFAPAHKLAEVVTGTETRLHQVVRSAKISTAVAAFGATHQQRARSQDAL